MRGKRNLWAMGLLLLALAAPEAARAGPYFGDWGWCWKEGKNCPKGCYSPCHYWTPWVYCVKYCLWPAHLDQYPPGLPVPTGWEVDPSHCRAVPPAPMHAYADPAGYYGMPIVPADMGQTEKKEESSDKK